MVAALTRPALPKYVVEDDELLEPAEGSHSSTWRNRIWAVLLTRLMTSVEALGMDTLIRLLPCCCTWAPVLPVPFTRDRRMDRAWSISADDGGWPCGVSAWSTTSVPLDRSSPSPTLNC